LTYLKDFDIILLDQIGGSKNMKSKKLKLIKRKDLGSHDLKDLLFKYHLIVVKEDQVYFDLSKEEYEDLTKYFDIDRSNSYKLNDYTLNYSFNLMIDNAKKNGSNDPTKLNSKKVFSLDIDNIVLEKSYK
jgi:hypothetical protein